MSSIAVATSSQLAADAAAEVAAAGGNAVDCALAASLMTMNTEPGVCALAGSAFITIWQDGSVPVTIDGNVAVPGAGLASSERGHGAERISMQYGGGIETLVGTGSVAVPGSLAALEHAWQRYGAAPWQTIFEPTIRVVRDGFRLSAACHYYLGYSGDLVFGRSADGFAALHHDDGSLLAVGEPVRIPHLADTLEAIARDGAALFYQGELARKIADHCRDGGGMLTRSDLQDYRAIERTPLQTALGGWQIASNPPPAVGGAVLSAMLIACSDIEDKTWTQAALQQLIQTQRACLDYRSNNLDLAEDVGEQAAQLIRLAEERQLLRRWTSAATTHTSVVDSSGTGCAITASSGYGSGEMPAGTGLWLNNCLGEIELNRRGLDAGPAGSRLPSNMAPSVARKGSQVLAVGSPGADRITTAMQQFLINYMLFGQSLDDAIAQPRLHVDTSGTTPRLMVEPGLDLPDVDLPVTTFPKRVMYFGGVSAAHFDGVTTVTPAADPRREGGTCVFSD